MREQPQPSCADAEAPAPDVFVWPPRSVQHNSVRSIVTTPSPADGTVPSGTTDAPAPSLVTAPQTRPMPQPSAAPPAPHRALWTAFQRTWLDLTAPPLADRAAALGFAADKADAYCHRCAHSIGPFESNPHGCPNCAGKRLPWARMIRLGEYRPPLTTFIHEVKFTRWRRLGIDLGKWLGSRIAERLDRLRAHNNLPPIVIVPVPITFRRRLFRGIDHTGAIARGVAQATGGRVVHALKRRHRPSQVSLPLSERTANIKKTITLKPGVDLRGHLVIVVDDVTTTGATMRAACGAINAAPQHRPTPARGRSNAGDGPAAQPPARSRRRASGDQPVPPPPVVWAAVLAVTPRPGRRASDPGTGPAPAEHHSPASRSQASKTQVSQA